MKGRHFLTSDEQSRIIIRRRYSDRVNRTCYRGTVQMFHTKNSPYIINNKN